MYILISGKPPYNGKNDKDIIEKAELGVLDFFGMITFSIKFIYLLHIFGLNSN